MFRNGVMAGTLGTIGGKREDLASRGRQGGLFCSWEWDSARVDCSVHPVSSC